MPPLLRAFLLMFIIGFIGVTANAQHTQLHEIQAQYSAGLLSVDEAVSTQLDLLQTSGDTTFVKCITPLISLITQNQDELSTETRAKVETLFGESQVRTAATEFYYTPGGKFRIIYETSGTNQVPVADENENLIPDYVELVAEAADSSYRHEINTLGFTDPIASDQTYDVFLRDLSNYGAYGLTNNQRGGVFACESASPATCIYIENDFTGYPDNSDPEGAVAGAVKVTMAHEFKHAIQYVQNSWSGDSDYWAEMDATLMEEVVYDNVNDYYNYISNFGTDFFSYPTRAFSNASSCGYSSSIISGCYEDITFALYFHEKYGPDFWTNVWVRLEEDNSQTFLEAVETELTERGESYNAAMLESYMWHFASGSEFSHAMYGFDENTSYPSPSIVTTFSALMPDYLDPAVLSPVSGRYYLNEPENFASQFSGLDGLVALNYTRSSAEIHFGLLAYFTDGRIETHFTTGSTSTLEGTTQTTWFWEDLEKLGLVVASTDAENSPNYSFQFDEYFISKEVVLAQNYPNPFNPSTQIQISVPTAQHITLTIYDVLGRHIQTLYSGRAEAGFLTVPFNAVGLSSGIYLYRVDGESGSKFKTMTLIR